MLQHLIEYILALPEEELTRMAIQDMAICASWHTSLREDPKEAQTWARVPAVVNQWATHVRRVDLDTEGRRHQWVLRELVEELQSGALPVLHWDEIEVLCSAYELAEKANKERLFNRVSHLLAPHYEGLNACRAAQPVAPFLPHIAERLHVITTEDVQRAPRRETRLFAGIDMPIRGPVFMHTGHLRLLGSVPENCTLVVENGSCSIEGFVLGRVAATGYCEVRENISGVVVVRHGSVRARHILNRAYVVSKAGDVVCRQTQMPDLVFAGRVIRIEGNAILGQYVAPRIFVREEAYGGEYHASECVAAALFRCSEMRPLAVLLRRSLSCRDYGEVPGEEASRLLAQAARLRERLTGLRDMAASAERDLEQLAGNAVYYLSGASSEELLRRLHMTQRRLAALDCLITGFQALGVAAEERLLAGEGPRRADVSGGALDLVDSGLAQLTGEGALEGDLEEAILEMGSIRSWLAEPRLDSVRATQLLVRARKRLRSTHLQRQQLQQMLGRDHMEALQSLGLKEGAEVAAGKHSNANLLKRLLGAARERGETDPLGARARSGYIRVVMRNIQSRLDLAQGHHATAERVKAEFAALARQLRDDYHILISEDPTGLNPTPRARGRFDAGVRIATDPFLLTTAEPPAESVIVTPARSEPTSFIRVLDAIVEAPSKPVVPSAGGAGSAKDAS